MKHSDSIASLAASLVAAQADMKAVAKDSVNPAFRSKFASLDNIVETVRPILAKHGLAVVQGASNPITDEAGALCGFAVETMLVHKSGEWLQNTALMPLSKVDPQGSGSAMTYGRRYSLSALLALATDEDDDANTATTQTVVHRATASRTAPAPRDEAPHPADEAEAPRDEASCPKCGGRMWDNRIGKKNPKAPDFKCRSAGCDGVIWPPKPNAA